MNSPRLLSALLAVLVSAAPLSAQADNILAGSVMDAGSGAPVPDAILRIEGTNVSAVSDADGHFVLRGLPAGPHALAVTHAGYGEHSMPVSVSRGGERFTVEIRLAAEGMSIQIVDATPAPAPPLPIPTAAAGPPPPVSELLAPAPRGGTVVDRARIQEAARSSRTLGEVIRQTIPALRPRQVDVVGTTLCLEFRGATSRSMRVNEVEGQCFHPQVFLDGIALQDPGAALNMTALDGIEWIQALTPAEAGAQYGSTPYGVIVIATTSGASRLAALGRPNAGYVLPNNRRRTFDWSEDPRGHPLFRAAAGAMAGNLVGLAVGLAVGEECIYVDDRTKEIERSCSKAGVAGVGLAAFALPALGSALGARWGGRTDGSQGSLVPSLLSASMMIFPGYVFSLMTVGDGVQTMHQVGKGILLVGTPVLVTLADRMFRKLRQ